MGKELEAVGRRKNSKGDTESGEYKTLPMLQSFYTEGPDSRGDRFQDRGDPWERARRGQHDCYSQCCF